MKHFLFTAVAMLLVAWGLSACTAKAGNGKQAENNDTMETFKDKKVLVAYFSWSQNTQVLAEHIAGRVNADVFRIERATPYPTDYDPCTEEAKAEKEAGERPALKADVDDLGQYDVIFLGVPVWWYTAPMPVFTFIENHDFAGKTVIPFCTCYTAEYETLADIIKATPEASHLEGLTIVTKEMGGKGMEEKLPQADEWLSKLGF